jgi:hypothetical protein
MRKLLVVLAVGVALLMTLVAVSSAPNSNQAVAQATSTTSSTPQFEIGIDAITCPGPAGQHNVRYHLRNISSNVITVQVTYQLSNHPDTVYNDTTLTLGVGETVQRGFTIDQGEPGATIQLFGEDGSWNIASNTMVLPDCGGTTTTSSTLPPPTTSPPPPPSCDCSGRQVTIGKPSRLLERVEKNKTGLTCFNVRLLDSGAFLVSGSGTDAALNRVFG